MTCVSIIRNKTHRKSRVWHHHRSEFFRWLNPRGFNRLSWIWYDDIWYMWNLCEYSPVMSSPSNMSFFFIYAVPTMITVHVHLFTWSMLEDESTIGGNQFLKSSCVPGGVSQHTTDTAKQSSICLEIALVWTNYVVCKGLLIEEDVQLLKNIALYVPLGSNIIQLPLKVMPSIQRDICRKRDKISWKETYS